MISVVLADDQALVRGGLGMILEAAGDISVVAEAQDGREVIQLSRELHPDVVLMDVRMPQVDGITATRSIVSGGLAGHVLVLTTFDEDQIVYDALNAGASGFLLKTTPPAQLVAAIRTVAAGEALLAPEVTRRLIERFLRPPTADAAAQRRLERLTRRELEVLSLIARGRSNGEIAAEFVVSDATVKTHVNRIFKKRSLRDRVQAVVLAYESGLVRPGE